MSAPRETEPVESPEQGDERDTLGRDVGTVSSLTLASRVLGLVRDLITVRLFGDTAVGSAFAAAFAIPNMFRRLFGEGALSAAFLPDYAKLQADDPHRSRAFASLTLAALGVVTGAITVLGEALLIALLLITPDDAVDRRLSLELIAITLPFMPLICSAAILGGMLQVHGRFAPWAAAPILLNLCVIGATVPSWTIDRPPAAWAPLIAAAVVLSGVLQVVWSLAALRPYVRWTTGFASVWPDVRAMLSRMVPALIGLGTLQLNAFADTLIAMWPNLVGPTVLGVDVPMDEASNSILFYAQRLYQFPLGVFGLAVASAIFPRLSRTADNPGAFAPILRRGLRLSLFIVVPASLGMILVASDLVRALFTGGAGRGFSDDGVTRASLTLTLYAGAIWAYSINHLWTRALYARGDTTTPMRIALSMVALNLVLNALVIWTLREAGLALSTAACAIVQCVLLARAVRRDPAIDAPVLDRSTVRAIARITACAVAMAGIVWLAMHFAPTPAEDAASLWWASAWRLVIAVGAGVVVYAGLAWLTRADELGWLIRRRETHA